MPDREHDISAGECWALLRQGWFGRVSLSLNALPTILPVEYCVADEELGLCLGHYDVPDRSLTGAVIGFATDGIDEGTHQGWVVQVQGLARLHTTDAPACDRHDRGRIVYLTPEVIHGQTLDLCPFGQGLLGP